MLDQAWDGGDSVALHHDGVAYEASSVSHPAWPQVRKSLGL